FASHDSATNGSGPHAPHLPLPGPRLPADGCAWECGEGDFGVSADNFIRIGTWNVEWANEARNRDHLAVLMRHPADIWILTETHRRLDIRPTHPFSVCSETGLNYSGVREIDADSAWVTIWSRFEFRGRIAVPNPRRQTA